MENNKVEQAVFWIDEIFYNGDRDECSLKHIINGLCLLRVGKTPTLQKNYVDYDNSGYPSVVWSMFGEDVGGLGLVSVFEPHLWCIVGNLYNSMSDKEKEEFILQMDEFDDIDNCHFMEYYRK